MRKSHLVLFFAPMTDRTNSLLLTSIFSAGNTYTYAAVRSLYGLALEGRAPKFLTYCTAKGVPIWCFCVVMCFPFLSFLQCSGSSANVITWLVDLITAGGRIFFLSKASSSLWSVLTNSAALIDYMGMAITYIRFHAACKAQGLDRKTLVRQFLRPTTYLTNTHTL